MYLFGDQVHPSKSTDNMTVYSSSSSLFWYFLLSAWLNLRRKENWIPMSSVCSLGRHTLNCSKPYNCVKPSSTLIHSSGCEVWVQIPFLVPTVSPLAKHRTGRENPKKKLESNWVTEPSGRGLVWLMSR